MKKPFLYLCLLGLFTHPISRADIPNPPERLTPEQIGADLRNHIIEHEGYLYQVNEKNEGTVISIHPVKNAKGDVEYKVFLGLKPVKEVLPGAPLEELKAYYKNPDNNFDHLNEAQRKWVGGFSGRQFTSSLPNGPTLPSAPDQAGTPSHPNTGAHGGATHPTGRPTANGGNLDAYNNWLNQFKAWPPASTETLSKWINDGPRKVEVKDDEGNIIESVDLTDTRVMDKNLNCMSNNGSDPIAVRAVFMRKDGKVALDLLRVDENLPLSKNLDALKSSAMVLNNRTATKNETNDSLYGSDRNCVTHLGGPSRSVDVKWKDGAPIIRYSEGGNQYVCKRGPLSAARPDANNVAKVN